jgi:hypothetical protein
MKPYLKGGCMKCDKYHRQIHKNFFENCLKIFGLGISIGTLFLIFSTIGLAAPPVPLPPHPPGFPPPLPPGPPAPHHVVPPPPLPGPLHPPAPPVILHRPPGLPPYPGAVWVPGYHRGNKWVPGYWSRPNRHRHRHNPGPPHRY